MKYAAELVQALQQFTGTENWYRHPLNLKVTYTDGVKYFADNARAYWLLDLFATELPRLKQDFLNIHVKVDGVKADLVADDGNDNVVWSRHIDYTDCPQGDWQFYMTDNVILLPSEY